MLRVEKMGVDDFPFAVQLANTMGWQMTLEDYEFAVKLEPEGCFMLFRGSDRAGVATCVSFGKVGWFGNLVVKDADRRKGAGAFLVKHALNYLKSAGAETVGLFTYPHLIEYYKQFGFKPDVDFLVLQGKAVSPVTEGALRLQAVKEQEVPAIINFDSQLFGACRKKLLEPILQGAGNLCYMAVDNNEISGYCTAKVHEEMAEVGPLMCRLTHGGTAKELLQTVLGKLRNRDVLICVPAEETSLLEVLLKAGSQENFRATRMFLGPATAKGCTYIAESLERG